ncbi:MAG: 1-(5-phosphoribosyl)-5-[(5-phosphoribosylamino)methylideneamino]imidazole-4-carboxamide isomerase [Bacteroidales bacterium]
MKIIPAIDILNGKCVRLTKGDFTKGKVYSDDPVETAVNAWKNGIKYLHLVDLDGAREKSPVNIRLLEKIAASTDLEIDYSGGLRDTDQIRMAFNCGAHQVTIGSMAVNNPGLFLTWLSEFGNERIVLSADSRLGKVATGGWTEKTDIELLSYIRSYQEKGVKYVICTDIEKDGTLAGPAMDLYREILSVTDIRLVASGGVSSVTDIINLKSAGCYGTIVGKALYEGKIDIKELAELC